MKKTLSLHAKQGDAFLSEATEILYGGAAGGGKSHVMRVAGISWCYDIPDLQVYIFRRTFPDLWKNHMEGPTGFPALLTEWINNGFVKINQQKNFIEFWNGSKIHLCSCQYEKDVIKYQGPEIHVLMIDELTQWIWSMYTYLRGRVRLGGLNLPEKYKGFFPRILCGANPGGVGHNSVKLAFIDLCQPMEIREMPKKEGGLKRQFIPALLEDNPTLMENDPDYEYRLEGMGDAALVKAMRWGLWDIVAGGALDDVWDALKHIIEPFDVPSTWRVDRSFDWGSSAPFSVGWWAESDGCEIELPNGKTKTYPRGTLFRIFEYYGWNGTPNQGLKMSAADVAKEIIDIEANSAVLKNLNVKPGPADTSIFDADDLGVSISDKMYDEGIDWEKADKRPGSRKVGLEDVRDRFKAGLVNPMEKPGLFVFNHCVQFIRTIPTLPRSQKDPDDVDTNVEDHIYDETRYRCATDKREEFHFKR